MDVPQIFETARQREVGLLSITDHDCMECQPEAASLAKKTKMHYLSGLEINVSFSHPKYRNGKPISLDFLAYGYDFENGPLLRKLRELRDYRNRRAETILERINAELAAENKAALTREDFEAIQDSVDGAFGRPHIAEHMVRKGLVENTQAAFDRYLVKCNAPKMPVSLDEASGLIKDAGGKLMLAHPNDPRGTSLAAFTRSLEEQQRIVQESIMPYIDGIECWHSRHDSATAESYGRFCRTFGLMATGGSDCHQNPVLIGAVAMPEFVAAQFGFREFS